MLTIYKHAHNLRKYSQLAKMLTTYENAHTDDLQKCSQLKKENVHNLRKCSQFTKMLQQLVKMLTTCKNAHNRESVLQLAKMLTSFNKMLTKHLYTSVQVLSPRLMQNAYNT